MTSVIGKFFTCRVLLIDIYDDAVGMGFRVWANRIIARIDIALSKEDLKVQMMIYRCFSFNFETLLNLLIICKHHLQKNNMINSTLSNLLYKFSFRSLNPNFSNVTKDPMQVTLNLGWVPNLIY